MDKNRVSTGVVVRRAALAGVAAALAAHALVLLWGVERSEPHAGTVLLFAIAAGCIAYAAGLRWRAARAPQVTRGPGAGSLVAGLVLVGVPVGAACWVVGIVLGTIAGVYEFSIL